MAPLHTSESLRITYSRIFSLVQNLAKSPLGPLKEIFMVLIFMPLGLDHAYFTGPPLRVLDHGEARRCSQHVQVYLLIVTHLSLGI